MYRSSSTEANLDVDYIMLALYSLLLILFTFVLFVVMKT